MNESKNKVKNVFKNGEYTTTKERYTAVWREFINKSEEQKTRSEGGI